MMIFFRKLGHALARDAIDDVGAMMAYYAILAVFPLLLCVVTLAVLVLPDNVINDATRLALEAAPSAARSLIASQVEALTQHARAGIAFGTILFAVWGASRGASGLMLTLNRLLGRVETRSWFHRQAITIALTVGVALLLVVALGLLVAGPILGHVIADRLGLGSMFNLGWTIVRWTAAGLLVMVVWGLAFRLLPDTDAPLRIFTPGAVVGVIGWIVISQLFGLYLDHVVSYGSVYGALGSAVIFLTWLWLSSMSLLFAAEVNAVLADLGASKKLGPDVAPIVGQVTLSARRTKRTANVARQ